jgi:hypothetical protein
MINGLAGIFNVVLIACDRISTAAVSASAALPFFSSNEMFNAKNTIRSTAGLRDRSAERDRRN